MDNNKIINGRNIFLRKLNISDVNKDYLKWLNDPQVNRFLESRFEKWSLRKLKNYVKSVNKNKAYLFLAIISKDNNRHVGNIKIGSVNQYHKFGEIGIIIGEKQVWGKGLGREAIELATRYAFKKLKLNKLIAGIYANNAASYKAFIKAGYREAGRLKKHRFFKGRYVDEISVEKNNHK